MSRHMKVGDVISFFFVLRTKNLIKPTGKSAAKALGNQKTVFLETLCVCAFYRRLMFAVFFLFSLLSTFLVCCVSHTRNCHAAFCLFAREEMSKHEKPRNFNPKDDMKLEFMGILWTPRSMLIYMRPARHRQSRLNKSITKCPRDYLAVGETFSNSRPDQPHAKLSHLQGKANAETDQASGTDPESRVSPQHISWWMRLLIKTWLIEKVARLVLWFQDAASKRK